MRVPSYDSPPNRLELEFRRDEVDALRRHIRWLEAQNAALQNALSARGVQVPQVVLFAGRHMKGAPN